MSAGPLTGLKVCVRTLAELAEGNPRWIENRNWQQASQGIAGLTRDVVNLQANIVPVHFGATEEIVDPRQMTLKLRMR
jgi:hypothetical protein